MDDWVKKGIQLGVVVVACVILVGLVYVGIQAGIQRVSAAISGDAIETYTAALRRAEEDLSRARDELQELRASLDREREWIDFLEIGVRGANRRALQLAIELVDLGTILNELVEAERGHRGDLDYGLGLVSRGAIILGELEEILDGLNDRGGD